MPEPPVLVLGAKQHDVLVETLLSVDTKMVFSPTLSEALNHLRRDEFLAVILDYQTLQENNHIIEFACKIRQTNSSIPLLIIAQQRMDPQHQRILLTLGHIHLLINEKNMLKLSSDAS